METQDTLDRSKLRYIDVNGVRTRVFEDGDGAPLVLVHGGAFGRTYSLDAWSLNLGGLAKRFKVVAFDRLGQGHTGNPLRSEDYTFGGVQRHAATLLRQLDLEPAHLVGHSSGGLVTTRIALDSPDLVRSLVIVDSGSISPGGLMNDKHPALQSEIDKRAPSGQVTRDTVRVEPDVQSWSAEHVTTDFVSRLLDIALLPKTEEAMVRSPYSTVVADLRAVRDRTLQEIEEHGLPQRMLLIWGLNDRSAPFQLGLEFYERFALHMNDPVLQLVSRAGHYCFRERPELFEEIVTSFCLGLIHDN